MAMVMLTVVAVLLTVLNIAAAAYLIGMMSRIRAYAQPILSIMQPSDHRQQYGRGGLIAGLAEEIVPPEELPDMIDTSEGIKLSLAAASATRTGSSGEESGDALVCNQEEGIFAVFDGVGENESLASRTAAGSLVRWIVDSRSYNGDAPKELRNPHREGRRLRLALDNAHAKLVAMKENSDGPGSGQFGCSAVAALRIGNIALVGWVGDARLYRLREGQLDQITVDHTLASEHFHTGLLTEEEALVSPLRQLLTGYLGSDEEFEPGLKELVLEADARYLFCNASLVDSLGETNAADGLRKAGDPEMAAEMLVTEAANTEPDDDMAAVVLFVEKE